jgi:tetratricopeptide (TPR) repeat protein
VAAFNKGDTAAAIAAFEAAVEGAYARRGCVNLALAYLQAMGLPEAGAQLEEASRLAPDDPRIAFQLGGAYIDAKDMAKAAVAFERGLARVPSPPDAIAVDDMVALGDVYFAQVEPERAMGQHQKALAAKADAAGA